jgi:hypothetical protein
MVYPEDGQIELAARCTADKKAGGREHDARWQVAERLLCHEKEQTNGQRWQSQTKQLTANTDRTSSASFPI